MALDPAFDAQRPESACRGRAAHPRGAIYAAFRGPSRARDVAGRVSTEIEEILPAYAHRVLVSDDQHGVARLPAHTCSMTG